VPRGVMLQCYWTAGIDMVYGFDDSDYRGWRESDTSPME
jgi:hypothetical protein